MQLQHNNTVRKTLPALPEGLAIREQWPEFRPEALPSPLCRREAVGSAPKGARWSLWPLTFEEYVSDDEPNLALSDPHGTARNRLVMWRRVTRTHAAPGWWAPSRAPSRLEGFVELGPPEYWRLWDENARRLRRKWLAGHAGITHTLGEATFDEFAQAYKQSSVARSTWQESLQVAAQMELLAPGSVRYLAARRLEDGAIHAGLALIDSPSTRNSYYAVGFYHDDAKDAPLMIGLMDEWFGSSLKAGYRFLHLGQFWQPGESKRWKGFSAFKAKFNPFYIAYPPLLWRFVRGRLW